MRYPFSPEILDAMPEELAELYRELELTLLREISKRVIVSDQLNEVTVQDIRALRAHGISIKEIKKAIAQAAWIGEKKLESLLQDVVERNQAYYTELIDAAKVTAPEALVDESVIQAIIRQTNEEFRNITASMGFLVDSGRTKLAPAKAYQWALDNALIQVQSGGISYNQAIANATRQLADSGLKVVDYESGHVDQVDVAVRRAVMTGVNQLNSRYSEDSMDYLETEYVEVSAHSGARDKDGPLGWENHKKWQGKVYWWKERSKGNPEYQYPEFEKTCGYGSVTGILGANCRHNYSPFIPGVMERTYTDEQLANIDPPDFEYEGKKYTHYEATQQQRAIERAVRKWKRREAAATDPVNKQMAQIRQRLLKQKYQEFSKKAHLRTQPERMKAYVPRKEEIIVTNTPKKPTNASLGFREVMEDMYKNATPNSHKIQDLKSFVQDGVTYQEDGTNVKFEYSERKKEIANLLEREFGGSLYMMPKVQGVYKDIKTPDYLFRGNRYDLKSLESTKPDGIYNAIHKKWRQADNFVVDYAPSGISEQAARKQVEKIFTSGFVGFVKSIVLVDNDRIVCVYVRK